MIAIRDFTTIANAVNKRWEELSQKELFVVDAGDLWAAYLAAFPEGSNPIYKERTEHDCCTCRHFIRRLGSVVATTEEGLRESVWDDWESLPDPYRIVCQRLHFRVAQADIVDYFSTKEGAFGTALTHGENGVEWHHFAGSIPGRHRSAESDSVRAGMRTSAEVLERGLREISLASLDLVIELAESSSIYRGEEFLPELRKFRGLMASPKAKHRDFPWFHARQTVARLKNTVIGTLLVDLSSGVDLEDAVKAFESKVAPHNYKRPKALITQGMVDQAMTKIHELGIESALERRFAKLEDVSVSNVLWVDRSVKPRLRGVAGILEAEVKRKKPRRSKDKSVEEISLDEFLHGVLPQTSCLGLRLENQHLGNFVTLTAPVHDDAENLFRWDNPFAWSYDGEVTDSIKERVKKAGGKVNARFRVSLGWFNTDDLDLHAIPPHGERLFFSNPKSSCGGVLDVDMNVCSRNAVRNAVENIFWNRGQMPSGQYVFEVHNYTYREDVDQGFELELQFDRDVRRFHFSSGLRNQEKAACLRVTIKHNKIFGVEILDPRLQEGSASSEKWGLKTQEIVPVDTVMLSPNYWDGNHVGNRHLFFLINGCKNPDPVRGIYNEFLRSELEPHRKVFEVLGAKTKAQPVEEQLSGLGFSSTRKERVRVVCDMREYEVVM